MIFSVGFAMGSYGFSRSIPLTPTETEHLAVAQEPELKRTQANANALDQQAIAEGQSSLDQAPEQAEQEKARLNSHRRP